MDEFWTSIVTFFKNLGKTVIGDIITALPELQQDILAAFTDILNAAIAYVVAKYSTIETVGPTPLTAVEKLALDNAKHNEAFNYVKNEITNNPSKYPDIPDSLLHCGLEIYYQKYLRSQEGNKGNGGPTGDFSK